MILVIDVGNTNIVLGVFDGDELVTNWRIGTDRRRTAYFSKSLSPGVVFLVSTSCAFVPSTIFRSSLVAVATPDKRCRKFRATRSPVNRARPCPLICAMTLPGASSLPSAISCSNLTSGSRQRKVRLAAGIPARMPCALL
jgi:hypothetical protein